MRKHESISLVIIFLGIALSTMLAFSQQNPTPPASQDNNPASTSTSEQVTPVKVEAPQPQEISIYGEVQSIDSTLNSMTIQYYDYDSDQEKNIEITANQDTKLTNAMSLADIKKGNWADVVYTITDTKNIAKSISVEKDEESAGTPAGTSATE